MGKREVQQKLREVQQKLEIHRRLRSGKPKEIREALQAIKDMSGGGRLDLCGASLGEAEFEGVNFSGADFSGADLSGARLSWSEFKGANFQGANLRGSNFLYSDLDGAYVTGALMEGMTGLSAARFAGMKGLERAVLDPGRYADAVAAGYRPS